MTDDIRRSGSPTNGGWGNYLWWFGVSGSASPSHASSGTVANHSFGLSGESGIGSQENAGDDTHIGSATMQSGMSGIAGTEYAARNASGETGPPSGETGQGDRGATPPTRRQRVSEWFTWGRLVAVCAVLVLASVLFTNARVISISASTHDIAVANRKRNEINTRSLAQGARSLKILQEATSPATKAASDARLAQAISSISCQTQMAVQRAVDATDPSHPNIMTAACVEFARTHPNS